MKKIISVSALILAFLLCFTACSSNTDESGKIASVKAPQSVEDGVSSRVDTSKIEIVLREKSFSVEGIWFSYSSFKKDINKLSTSYGEKDLDVYIENGTFSECEISEKDSVGNHTYTITYGKDGLASAYTKYSYNEYGNCETAANYNKSGKLVSINKYKYDKNANLISVYLYGANKKLKNITEYVNDDNGKVQKKYFYSADGKLISYSKFSYSGDERIEHMYDATGKSTGTVKS